MKKIISIALAAALVFCSAFVFSACGKGEAEGFELVMITDGAPINDGGYNESAWNGVMEYAEEKGVSCRYYQPPLNDSGELDSDTASEYIELAADGGAKTIVLIGEPFAVSAYEVAPTYRDIQFILVDAFPHTKSDDSMRLQQNVMCISFDALQAGFLAGYYSVAEEGKTKLGYFGAVNGGNSNEYGAGFAQGAAYAADEKGIPVSLEYANYDDVFLDYDYSFIVRPIYIPVSEAKEKTYKVTVVNGIGSGVYTEGENVKITADTAPEGKAFDHWEVKSDTEGVKDKKVNISNKKKAEMNLLVGDCDCTITAVWADAETVSVTVTEKDGITAHEVISTPINSSVEISASAAPSGMVFEHWEASDESLLEDVNSAKTKVNASANSVIVTPVYNYSDMPVFNVTVENGSGSGTYQAGDEVKLVADAPEEGYMFYKWENADSDGVSTGISMENEYCYTTSFEMIDRYASIPEKMFDGGTEVIFGGGNPEADSIFTAVSKFDYPVYAFGSGIDESKKGSCLASVINNYGAAVKLALSEFQGGSIFVGGCSNDCIYITNTSRENSAYGEVYNKLASGVIKPKYVAAGADFRQAVDSECLTINYWTML